MCHNLQRMKRLYLALMWFASNVAPLNRSLVLRFFFLPGSKEGNRVWESADIMNLQLESIMHCQCCRPTVLADTWNFCPVGNLHIFLGKAFFSRKRLLWIWKFYMYIAWMSGKNNENQILDAKWTFSQEDASYQIRSLPSRLLLSLQAGCGFPRFLAGIYLCLS